jgi:hypothetical protein
MDKMNFTVYNNRRSNELNYSIQYNNNGWHISHIAINGECEPNGEPYFYMNFRQDYINYPSGFGFMLEWIWEKIRDNEFDEIEAQKKLQELADWVSKCEKSTPKWQGYNI